MTTTCRRLLALGATAAIGVYLLHTAQQPGVDAAAAAPELRRLRYIPYARLRPTKLRSRTVDVPIRLRDSLAMQAAAAEAAVPRQPSNTLAMRRASLRPYSSAEGDLSLLSEYSAARGHDGLSLGSRAAPFDEEAADELASMAQAAVELADGGSDEDAVRWAFWESMKDLVAEYRRRNYISDTLRKWWSGDVVEQEDATEPTETPSAADSVAAQQPGDSERAVDGSDDDEDPTIDEKMADAVRDEEEASGRIAVTRREPTVKLPEPLL